MKCCALLLAATLFACAAEAAPTVLLESPVRILADVLPGAATGTTKLALTVQHGTGAFVLSVAQRGTATEALAAQKATSGWKDDYLFIRDDCLNDPTAVSAWRCVVDHVFMIAEDAKSKSGGRLIYVGEVFAGDECIDAPRIGCALYKGTFSDIYDWLEDNAQLTRAESPAVLIESTVQGGVFTVDLEDTWKANQERFLAGARCLQAKPELQKERCIDGINPRRAYFFNTVLATYSRREEHLMRTRAFARAVLCERERLSESGCSEALRASALLLAGIKPGERPRLRGNVSSVASKEQNLKP